MHCSRHCSAVAGKCSKLLHFSVLVQGREVLPALPFPEREPVFQLSGYNRVVVWGLTRTAFCKRTVPTVGHRGP